MQSIGATNVFGIDVSHHQDLIDWTAVANDGVEFAFIKATEGRTGIDAQFRRNAMGADAVGIPAGFYHYAHPETNAVANEVYNFLSTVNGLPCKLPYVLDLEGDAAKIGRDKVSQWAYDFMTQVKKQSGHDIMLYTGASFAKDYCGAFLGAFPLWVAHYGAQKPLDNPTWKNWAAFQYASDGTVAGINGKVDVNKMEVTFLEKYTKSGAKRLTPFKDVEAGRWTEEAIAAVTSMGLMNGTAADLFDPKSPLSREQYAVVTYNLIKFLRGKGVKI